MWTASGFDGTYGYRRVFEGLLPLGFRTPTCPRSIPGLLIRRSPPRLLTAAARTGLRPAPESRSRWAYHHLLRSFAPRFSVQFIAELLSVPLRHTPTGSTGATATANPSFRDGKMCPPCLRTSVHLVSGPNTEAAPLAKAGRRQAPGASNAFPARQGLREIALGAGPRPMRVLGLPRGDREPFVPAFEKPSANACASPMDDTPARRISLISRSGSWRE